MAVSLARGLAEVDPLAARVLPLPIGYALRLAERVPAGVALANVSSLGLVSHLKWRTRAIDEDLATSEFRQLLLLGAGLCTRAHRLSLPGVTVFEVDHPATQRRKRAAMERASHRAAEVRYLGVDFDREDFVSALDEAGFDRHAKTYVIWEGVVMYLPVEATRKSLRGLRELCAPGSRLAVSYMSDFTSSRWIATIANTAFAAIGEPLRASYTAHEMQQLLREEGFMTLHTDGSPLSTFALERLAFAERVAIKEG